MRGLRLNALSNYSFGYKYSCHDLEIVMLNHVTTHAHRGAE